MTAVEGRWAGETVVCIASGPSLTKADCETVAQAQRAGRCRVIVVNSTYPMAPWADVLYASDAQWWMHYTREVKLGKWQPFAGERWTVSRQVSGRLGLNLVHGFHGTGLSTKPGMINLGGNSGHAGIGLAVLFGAVRIVLLGYDMQRTGGRSHHHGDHPHPLGNGNVFPSWIRRFAVLAKDAGDRGVEIVNATRQTALTCFPRVSIEDALCTK